MKARPGSEDELSRPARRIVASLFAVQSMVFGAIIAMATVNSIVAADLTGNPAWAGAPAAILSLAGGVAALGLGSVWDRLGRRVGLSVALGVGLLGAAMAALSVELRWVWLFGLGVVALAVASSGARLSRFIAAEVSRREVRGRAISIVVWGGTLGAVGGPLLVGPSSRVGGLMGLGELTGPILVAVPLIALSVVVSFVGLRPEPLELSRRLETEGSTAGPIEGSARPFRRLIREPGVAVAIVVVLVAQTVMVMLMGITSLYMKDLEHSLADISLVFAAHTLGMYAFSPLSGRLSDSWGRGPVLIAGGLTALVSTAVAPYSEQVPWIMLGLFLLGLGWNLCFVAGSALLADQLSPPERSRTQGANDMLIGLSSGIGSLGSGVIYAGLGYGAVGILGGSLMMGALALSAWWTLGRRSSPLAAAE